MKRTPKTFAARVEVARKASKKTLKALAAECGFSTRQNLFDWMRKKSRDEDLERFAKLAEALGVDFKWLAFGDEK